MTITERIAAIREHLDAIEVEIGGGVAPMAAPPSGGGQGDPDKPKP